MEPSSVRTKSPAGFTLPKSIDIQLFTNVILVSSEPLSPVFTAFTVNAVSSMVPASVLIYLLISTMFLYWS